MNRPRPEPIHYRTTVRLTARQHQLVADEAARRLQAGETQTASRHRAIVDAIEATYGRRGAAAEARP